MPCYIKHFQRYFINAFDDVLHQNTKRVTMEFINGKKVLEAGDGDIILQHQEPYIIDDEELIEAIKQKRENEKTFSFKGKTIEILEYLKGNSISKTLVKISQ